MTNRLKFRAWCLDKIMLTVGVQGVACIAPVPNEDNTGIQWEWINPNGTFGTDSLAPSDCIVMQWTGLTDKYDADIYEGDIIALEDIANTQMIVSWDAEQSRWHIPRIFEGNALDTHVWKIIGNIYESVSR